MGSMKRVVSIYLIILLSVADNERLEVRSLPLKPIVELEKGSAQRVDFSSLPYTLVLLMVWLPLLLFFMVCNRFHADKNNHFESIKQGYPIGWGKYCKSAIPATILVLVISTVMIIVRYC